MKISVVSSQGGYALPAFKKAGIDGTEIEKPFVLLSGQNGSGKSALLGAIRNTMKLTGDRHGKSQFGFGVIRKSNSELPASLDPVALGYAGQKTFLFDSRSASGLASRTDLDDDILYHATMIAGGGSRVSHGQFVGRVWNEAVAWALSVPTPADAEPEPAKKRPRKRRVAKSKDGPQAYASVEMNEDVPGADAGSSERWLLLDEPENAIDINQLTLGLCGLLEAAEIGRLRVFCSSHSLLFAAGLVDHPKVQVIDFSSGVVEGGWIGIQKRSLDLVKDPLRVAENGERVIKYLRERPETP